MAKDYPVEIEREIAAPPKAVWAVLTDPQKLSKMMMGAKVSSDFKAGSPITYTGEWKGKAFHDKGEILEAKSPSVLRMTHFSDMSGKEDKPENYNEVTYRLEAKGEGTVLHLTQVNNATAKSRDESAKTWTAMLDTLAGLAEGK